MSAPCPLPYANELKALKVTVLGEAKPGQAVWALLSDITCVPLITGWDSVHLRGFRHGRDPHPDMVMGWGSTNLYTDY